MGSRGEPHTTRKTHRTRSQDPRPSGVITWHDIDIPEWAVHDADHNSALTAFYSTFGDIMPTDVLIGLLTGR
jgi:hypothetical protein